MIGMRLLLLLGHVKYATMIIKVEERRRTDADEKETTKRNIGGDFGPGGAATRADCQ